LAEELRVRPIQGRRDVGRKPAFPYGRHHADDFRRVELEAREVVRDALANRITAAEILLGSQRVDDDDLWGAMIIARSHIATAQQFDPESSEVLRTRQIGESAWREVGVRWRVADDVEMQPTPHSKGGHAPAERGAHNPGLRLELLGQAGQKLALAVRRGIALSGECDLGGEDTFRAESGIHALEPSEAFDKETGAREQHEGDRDLRDHEPILETVLLFRPGATSALFEHVREIGARRLPGGNDTENEHGGERR